MLVGISLAILPVVVHLLSRARYRSVDWGAMMFLEGAKSASVRSRRISQFFLLLMRACMVALLAVALARPEWHGKFTSTGPGRRGIVVIVLDCSASMNFDENGHTRMELAREAAKQVLSLHHGDHVSLVLMGQNQPRSERLPTADLWDVGRRIESAEPAYGRADVARSLDDALEAVEPRDAPGDKAAKQPVTFYVVTDRQASNWREILEGCDEWSAGWKQRMARSGLLGRTVVIPVGSQESENVVVKSVELINPPAVVGQPMEVEVKVQNYGAVQWAAMPLQISADKRMVFDQKVNLTADATASFRVTIPAGFPEVGTHILSAELNRPSARPLSAAKPTGFPNDDRLDTVIDVQDPLQVLIISGDDTAGEKGLGGRTVDPVKAADKESQPVAADYIAAALTPFRSAKRKLADVFVVERAVADAWSGPAVQLLTQPGSKRDAVAAEVRLNRFEVIVLANIERLTDSQVVAVEQFVNDGGGVLIAPGELTRTDEYNSTLFREGAGILPAALAEPTSADGVEQTTLQGFDATHPLLKFLNGRPDSFLSCVVGRHCPTERTAGASRVIMRYANGSPFLIESGPGSLRKGRVLLLTTALDADWSTLPLTSFYLPLLQSAARYLVEGSPRKLNVAPGDPLELTFEESAEGRTVRVRTPEGEDRAVEIARAGGQLIARFAETESPGIYTLRVSEPGKKATVVHFSVTPSREESNMTALSSQEWRQLEKVADMQKLDPAIRPISLETAIPAPLEIGPWALGAMLLLAVLEMKLSAAWSPKEPVGD